MQNRRFYTHNENLSFIVGCTANKNAVHQGNYNSLYIFTFIIRWVSLFVVVFQSVSKENANSAQMNVAIHTIYSLFLEYFKV